MIIVAPLFNSKVICNNTSDNNSDAHVATVADIDPSTYKPPEHSDNPVSEHIASFAEAVALDDSHGYSQARRTGNPDYDCSSLVYYAVTKGAGVNLGQPYPFATPSMKSVLTRSGFTHLSWSGNPKDAVNQLKRGDIIVNPSTHTEVYVGGGLFAGARHATPQGIEDGNPGDQGKGAKQEIGISSGISTNLYDVYRYSGDTTNTNSDSGQTVAAVWSSPSSSACHPAAADASAVSALVPKDLTHAKPEDARAYAKNLMSEYGWDTNEADTGEFGCLVWVWNHESGWRWDADNPTSDAYGIPQALPGSKMASIAPDWRDNAATQIIWGMQYIKYRYKSPCGAKEFWQTHHWY